MKKYSRLFLPVGLLIILSLIVSCGQKKKEKEKSTFIPVVPIIKSQCAHIDTSLYTIMKITVIDSVRSDTEYVKREDFRKVAQDFLTIPDITLPEYSGQYDEDTLVDDDILNRLVFVYTPIKRDQSELQRQEVLISKSGIEVKSFIIDLLKNTRDSSVQKRMLWQVDQSFQIATIVQKPNQPESVSVIRVVWNDPGNQ